MGFPQEIKGHVDSFKPGNQRSERAGERHRGGRGEPGFYVGPACSARSRADPSRRGARGRKTGAGHDRYGAGASARLGRASPVKNQPGSVWLASFTGERDGRVVGSNSPSRRATRRLFLWHGFILGLLRRLAIETYQFT
jgi:hypothetical protein